MQRHNNHKGSPNIRRRYLLKAAGLLAVSPAFGFISQAHSAAAPIVSVRDYGAKGDGAANDTKAITSAFAANRNAMIVVPAGTYMVDNPIVISWFNGRMRCEDGVRFLFTNPNQPGWTFRGGTGASILNFRSGWKTPGTSTIPNSAGLNLDTTYDTWVDNCIVDNSNGTGITCFNCTNPTLTNVSVQNTRTNGLIFLDCNEGMVLNAKTNNTGDDGLEYVNHATSPYSTGGYARNIVVSNSQTRGISVNGHSNVTINGFSINGTGSSGILVDTDTRWNTRVPENVTFTNGTIQNAGTVGSGRGNRFGIEVYNVKSAAIEGVTTTGSINRGLCVYAPSGIVALRDVRVLSPSQDAGANLMAQSLVIDSLQTENTPGYGIVVWNSASVVARRLSATNASQSSSLARAIWFEDNEKILVELLRVVDTQAVPTGYIVGCSGRAQVGTLKGISSDIGKYGPVDVQISGSPSVAIAPLN